MLKLSESRSLLQVEISASEDEINRAFRRRSKELHPDVNPAPDANEQFVRLQQARDLLLDQLGKAEPSADDVPRYRPAKPVSEDKREDILGTFRRRREAEARRRSRRRSAVKGQAQRTQRKNDEFQQEMARRRAAFEAKSREEQQQESRREEERARAAREQRERETAEAENERRAAELQKKREREQREQEALERVEREARERAQRESRERATRATPMQDAPETCAWKGCRETELAAPLPTALGLRRFCRTHYDEYIEFRRRKDSRDASAAGGRSRRGGS